MRGIEHCLKETEMVCMTKEVKTLRFVAKIQEHIFVLNFPLKSIEEMNELRFKIIHWMSDMEYPIPREVGSELFSVVDKHYREVYSRKVLQHSTNKL